MPNASLSLCHLSVAVASGFASQSVRRPRARLFISGRRLYKLSVWAVRLARLDSAPLAAASRRATAAREDEGRCWPLCGLGEAMECAVAGMTGGHGCKVALRCRTISCGARGWQDEFEFRRARRWVRSGGRGGGLLDTEQSGSWRHRPVRLPSLPRKMRGTSKKHALAMMQTRCNNARARSLQAECRMRFENRCPPLG